MIRSAISPRFAISSFLSPRRAIGRSLPHGRRLQDHPDRRSQRGHLQDHGAWTNPDLIAMDHLYFVVHTHWDREWYEPFQRMRARLVAMTDRMLTLVEEGKIPCFHFDGQTIVLEDYLEVRPENARRIAKLVKDGRIQIGPWYVLADSFLVSGESLIRNLEIGGRIARRLGEPIEIGYLPDQFGHIAQMPQILAGFGLKAAIVWRGVGREIERNRFVWQALDGTEIFTTYLPFGYSNG